MSAEQKTVRCFFAMRSHSEIERAHIVADGEPESGRVETRCGLTYTVSKFDTRDTAPDDLPREVCRNCKRSLDSERGDDE